jgi:thioredoxin 2
MVVTCPECGRKNRVPAAHAGAPRCGACGRRLPWTAEAGDDTFIEVVEGSGIPVLVDFWAPWCAPCHAVSPVLEDLAHELAGKVKLVKVNVDEAPKLADRFAIQHVPTLLVMSRGQAVAQRSGAAPAPVLRAWVGEALAVAP